VTKGPYIADRLAAARSAGFIGREAEKAGFRSALTAHPPPFTVLHIHGPGGVGKTTLLHELARIASEAGRSVVVLDGRDVEPSRAGFTAALERALGADGGQSAGVPDGAVVLIDTYEALSVLDTWLRETVLPAWSSRVVVVLAGREAPARPWTTDIAWASLSRVVSLQNFTPDESRAFLRGRAVERGADASVLAFTRGHPLALALVSEVLARHKSAGDFDPVQAPDVVRHLWGLFLATVHGEREREALAICAVARVTTEALLVELMGPEDGRQAFDWLHAQSFVQSGSFGLFPHDLVRELVVADARWRDGAAFAKRFRQVYRAVHAQIAAARGLERQRLQMDALFVTRNKPTNAAFFDWSALDDARTEPAEAADTPWILDLVARHEGPESAEIAARWWRTQPAAFRVFRGPDEAQLGFLALLDVAGAGPTEPTDAAIVAARAFVEKHGPVRRGDAVVYLRWWMHAEAYQAVTAAINLTAMHVVSHCVTRPGVAWNFVAMADPDFWKAHFDGVNFPRVPEADFEIGGRRYGVFAHDWRIEPPSDWLTGAQTAMPFAAGRPAGPEAPLGQPEFERAVRQALRDFTRPDALADGPLRAARLVRDARDAGARASALQALLRAAADDLLANPRDRKLHDAVWRTYFEPLATQELAAERLSLPFSTYRRHLARGVDHIACWLWNRERSLPLS